MPASLQTVRSIALSLDAVMEKPSYGTPGFRVGKELFARYRPDLDSLVLRMDFKEREEMMARDPETFYITDHYLYYPWVLVRLSRVSAGALRKLMEKARKTAASGKGGGDAARFARQMRPKAG